MTQIRKTRRNVPRNELGRRNDWDARKQRRNRFLRLETLEPRQFMAVITTLAQLQSMSLSGSHTLGADIDASTAVFIPVGSEASPFTGSLNGSGYKITGLKINSFSPYVGLFGFTSNATLTDIVLENVDINATYGGEYPQLHVGGLVGKAVNTSISDSEVSGDIDAGSYGGVYAGGLVGYSSNTSDKDLVGSISSASVDGRTDINNAYGGYGGYVGGLVGRADGLDVSASSATGPVTAYGGPPIGSYYGGQYHYAGGLIGYNYLTAASGADGNEVINSFATGYVKANTGHPYGGAFAGGLIGYNHLSSTGTGAVTFTLDQSYATGTADADLYNFSIPYAGTVASAGGLVGYNYVATSGSGSAAANITLSRATGLADVDTNSYGGPLAYAGGLIGYNTSTSTNSGSATTTVDQSFATGTADATAFNAVGYGGTGAGTPLGYAGGLVGYSHVSSASTGTAGTTIDESYATGPANAYGSTYSGQYGGAYAGGLVGYDFLFKGASATASATISNTYATGNAMARAPVDASAGGLIGGVVASGAAAAQVQNSYSIGVPDTQYDASPFEGGLVGYGGNVSFTSSYWDTQTSGKTDGVDNIDPDPSGVTGKTTQQMSSQASFTGWDFDASGVAARDNGVWIMGGYPHLQMEYFSIQTVAGNKSITNAVELQMMALDLSESYELANDINATTTATWNWDAADSVYRGFDPVGDATAAFAGDLDGAGHKITSLRVNRKNENSVGLFGRIAGSTIQGLNLEGVDIDGSHTTSYLYAGGLAGEIYGGSTVTGTTVSGTVDAVTTSNFINAGGLTGVLVSNSSIADISTVVAVTVSGPGVWAGGLIGQWFAVDNANVNTTVTRSSATGNVSANSTSILFAGGLVGEVWIQDVSGYDYTATLSESFATGDVSANGSGAYSHAGGLVGTITGPGFSFSPTSAVHIADSYAWGDVTVTGAAPGTAGGLVGYIYAGTAAVDVARSYSTGDPTASSYAGGLVGENTNGTFTDCYWDTTTSGTADGVDNVDPDPSGVNGRTTAQMMQQSTFVNWDFDASGIAARDNGVWIMAGYPHLQAEWSTSITNAYQVQMMALDLDADYQLVNNIAFPATAEMNLWNGGAGFNPVGTFVPATGWAGHAQEGYHPDPALAFTGTLDGQNYQISSLQINRTDVANVGLFGALYDSRDESVGGLYTNAAPSEGMVASPDAVTARVQNLTLHNVRIAGGSFVGALAGRNYARIVNSKVTTAANDYADESTAYVKGGGNRNNGNTWYGSNIGGFAGSNSGVIRDSGAEVYVSYNRVNRGGVDYDTHLNDTAGFVGDNNDLETDLAVPIDRAMIFSSYSKGSVIAQQVRAIATDGALLNTNIGGFVGENDGYIQGTQNSRAYATGETRGYATVGGFAGKTDAPISWAYATGAVNASNSIVGGFAGENEDDIDNSYATGSVTLFIADNGTMVSADHSDLEYFLVNDDLDVSVGGFVGVNQDGGHDGNGIRGETDDGAQIRQSYATGNVTLDTPEDDPGTVGVDERIEIQINATGGGADTLRFNVGGFVGYQDDNGAELIDQSYYRTGIVSVDLEIGHYHEHNTDGSAAADSGEIRLWVGGFAGRQKRVVQQVYTAAGGVQDASGGQLTAADIVIAAYHLTGTTGLTADVAALVGGLVGNLEATLTGSYWDLETVEPDHDATRDMYPDVGSTGATSAARTTAQMKTQATFVDWLFDTSHWELDSGDYPEFWWED